MKVDKLKKLFEKFQVHASNLDDIKELAFDTRNANSKEPEVVALCDELIDAETREAVQEILNRVKNK